MTPETFFENFGHLADAPNGVEKLRELVLQMAVRGRLTESEPEEGTGRELHEKLLQEKQRLTKAKLMRRSKALPEIKIDEKPFQIPKHWKFVRLNDVGEWGSGGTPLKTHQEYYGGDIPWLVIGDLNGTIVHSAEKYITQAGLENSSAVLLEPNTLLIAMYGSIGKLGVTGITCATNQAIAFCKPFAGIDLWFLFWLLREARDRLTYRGKGLAQQNISQTVLKNFVIGLPPLEEQKRIVAKVDELMNHCDRLETAKASRTRVHAKLTGASLNALSTADSPQTFGKSWRRVQDNFAQLFDTPESVQDLRQTILQLAVQGKLVPQDPNDESAEVLLERIIRYKTDLIKAKVIPKTIATSKVSKDEQPFELPEFWLWCRWDQVSLQIGDVDHKMPSEVKEGIPYVSPRDFYGTNDINFDAAKKISEADFERLSKKIQPRLGDLIFPRYGTIGENRLVRTTRDFLASYSCATVKRLPDCMVGKYIFYYSLSGVVKSEIERYKNKTTQANVGVKSIKNFIFPLPPLNEQKRIVAKVDSLMTLCDALEAKLARKQGAAEALAAATVQHMQAA